MKAYRCEAFETLPVIVLREMDQLRPGPHDVLVRVAAAGVGYVDALIASGGYQIKPPLPFTPCADVAGEVVAVGTSVTGFAPGDHVLALASTGGLADHALAREALAVKLPDEVDFHSAAASGTNYYTARYGLIDLGRGQRGETLLVLGAGGGLGMAAVDMGRSLGLRVIALCGGAEKLRAAREQGAVLAFDYTKDDWRATMEAKVGRSGIDLVFDPVGGEAAEPAFRTLAPGGRHLVLGFVSGQIARLPMNLALLKRATLVGVDWGGAIRADPALFASVAEQVVAGLASGALRPSGFARIPFAGAAQALQGLLDRRVVGRQVVTIDTGGPA